jgi:hypothetical protein
VNPRYYAAVYIVSEAACVCPLFWPREKWFFLKNVSIRTWNHLSKINMQSSLHAAKFAIFA